MLETKLDLRLYQRHLEARHSLTGIPKSVPVAKVLDMFQHHVGFLSQSHLRLHSRGMFQRWIYCDLGPPNERWAFGGHSYWPMMFRPALVLCPQTLLGLSGTSYFWWPLQYLWPFTMLRWLNFMALTRLREGRDCWPLGFGWTPFAVFNTFYINKKTTKTQGKTLNEPLKKT